MKTTAFALFLALLAGCQDFSAPSDLDHTQILAVRTQPAQLAPGERARIDLLVTDSAAMPRVVAPADVTTNELAASALARDEQGWTLTAPDAETLASARQTLGLPDDAPVPLPITVRVEIDGLEKTAEKIVFLGRRVDPPSVPVVTIDGAPMPEAGLQARIGDRPKLGASATAAAGEISYAWYSSVGKLIEYRSPSCTLEAKKAGEGLLVVVARDPQGGVAWTIVPAAVTP